MIHGLCERWWRRRRRRALHRRSLWRLVREGRWHGLSAWVRHVGRLGLGFGWCRWGIGVILGWGSIDGAIGHVSIAILGMWCWRGPLLLLLRWLRLLLLLLLLLGLLWRRWCRDRRC